MYIVLFEWEKLCVSCVWIENCQYSFLSYIWRVESKATDIDRQDKTIICFPLFQTCWIRISYYLKTCLSCILTCPSISISISSVWGRPKAAMFPIRRVSSSIASTYGISRRCLLETSFSWPLWKYKRWNIAFNQGVLGENPWFNLIAERTNAICSSEGRRKGDRVYFSWPSRRLLHTDR